MEKRERKKGISTGRIKCNLRRSNCCSNVVSSCATRMPRSGTSNRPYPPFFRISADSLGPIAPCGIVSSARAFFLYKFRSNFSYFFFFSTNFSLRYFIIIIIILIIIRRIKKKKIKILINYNYKERSNRETILMYIYIYISVSYIRSFYLVSSSRFGSDAPKIYRPAFRELTFQFIITNGGEHANNSISASVDGGEEKAQGLLNHYVIETRTAPWWWYFVRTPGARITAVSRAGQK